MITLFFLTVLARIWYTISGSGIFPPWFDANRGYTHPTSYLVVVGNEPIGSAKFETNRINKVIHRHTVLRLVFWTAYAGARSTLEEWISKTIFVTSIYLFILFIYSQPADVFLHCILTLILCWIRSWERVLNTSLTTTEFLELPSSYEESALPFLVIVWAWHKQ